MSILLNPQAIIILIQYSSYDFNAQSKKSLLYSIRLHDIAAYFCGSTPIRSDTKRFEKLSEE
ncbi:MAG: hypothetical protein CBE29_01815 [Rickettsiales bacterium TMED269]|nr:MAG: hypothetical protein CBE29_01815 [Rickettsiales bacterium TMED269]